MRRNPYWQHLYVVKGDAEPALRNWALSLLIEDRVDKTASYSQFLALIKDKVGRVRGRRSSTWEIWRLTFGNLPCSLSGQRILVVATISMIMRRPLFWLAFFRRHTHVLPSSPTLFTSMPRPTPGNMYHYQTMNDRPTAPASLTVI